MSQLGGISPPSSVTIDSMLALAEFVKNPQHVEYVRDLKAAQEAHDKAAAAAKQLLDDATAAKTKLATDKAAHEKMVAERVASNLAKDEELRTKAADLARRELALTQRAAQNVTAIEAHNRAASA